MTDSSAETPTASATAAATDAGGGLRADWTAVCRLTDLEPGWGEAALVGDRQVALMRLPDGEVLAVDNVDPLTGAAVVSRGILGSRAGRATIITPLRKDPFDLRTGVCQADSSRRLATWRVCERDGTIFVTPRPALVAASHGTADPVGQRMVAGLVAAVMERLPEVEVIETYIDLQQPDLAAAVRTAGTTPQVIVPLLLSAGYHVATDLHDARRALAGPGWVAPALGPDPRLLDLVQRRLSEAGFHAADGDHVVLAAAGSTDLAAVADCRQMGTELGRRLQLPVTTAFVSHAAPDLSAAIQDARSGGASRVIVASYLLAPGHFASRVAAVDADLVSVALLDPHQQIPTELVDIVADRYLNSFS